MAPSHTRRVLGFSFLPSTPWTNAGWSRPIPLAGRFGRCFPSCSPSRPVFFPYSFIGMAF